MTILRFPTERIRPPGLLFNKTSATFSILLNPMMFESLMRSYGLRHNITQVRLTESPKLPALTYVPSSP